MLETFAPTHGRSQGDAFSIFGEVLKSVARGEPTDRTLDLICRRVCELGEFSFCGVLLPDAAWRRVRLAGSHGFPEAYVERLHELFLVPISDQAAGSPTRAAIERRRTVVLRDAQADEAYRPWRALAVEFDYRSLISVPLEVDGSVIGVLNGYSARRLAFTAQQLAAVEALAGQAALSLRLTILVEARQETIAQLRETNAELERQRAMLERAHEIHRRLTTAVITGADFEGVAMTLAELIDRAVAITDVSGHVICTSEATSAGSIGGLVEEAVPRLRTELASGKGARTRAPEIESTIVEPIHVGDERLGYVVVPEGEPASRELDVRAVEHAATVLALEIVKERVARTTEERLHADFLSDLVRGRDVNEHRMAERARHYGLTLGTEHRVLVLVIEEQDGRSVAAPDEAAARARRARARNAVQREIGGRAAGTLVGAAGDTVTAVCPVAGLPDPIASLREAVTAAQDRVRKLDIGLVVSTGIGGPARTAAEITASHRDAELCLELAHRLERRGDTFVRDELGILGLFVDTNRPDELAAVARQTLGPAIDRDAERGGDLIKTLDAYLDGGCDARTCGAALFVHANTVKYRLRKVEELCGLDLRRPSDLLSARIATLTLKLL